MSGTQRAATLSQTIADAFRRRRSTGLALKEHAEAMARAGYDMARRFHQGGKLIAFGNGGSSTDAQHIAVEFVHPVIVGKRALPAIALTNDIATMSSVANHEGWDDVFAHQLKYLAQPQDIALGISVDGRCVNVVSGLTVAREMGLLTIALTGGLQQTVLLRTTVDHLLAVSSEDPRIVKELQVSIYHILWEVTHVFFDDPDALELRGTLGARR